MTITTRSQFYYSDPVAVENRFLDFSEGGPEINGEVDVGSRSPSNLLSAVSRALNSAGALVYSVTFNRVTNRAVISAPTNFELLVTTGTNSGQSVFGLLGFTVDKTGSNSYESDVDFITIYRPQFLLQKYISPDRWQENVKATISEAANGVVETFSFGERSFYEFDIMFITDIAQGANSPIETNATGVADAIDFLKFCATKSDLEFMPNRDTPAVFDTVLFESGAGNSKGTGFKLGAMRGGELPYYYETKTMKFRKVL